MAKVKLTEKEKKLVKVWWESNTWEEVATAMREVVRKVEVNGEKVPPEPKAVFKAVKSVVSKLRKLGIPMKTLELQKGQPTQPKEEIDAEAFLKSLGVSKADMQKATAEAKTRAQEAQKRLAGKK